MRSSIPSTSFPMRSRSIQLGAIDEQDEASLLPSSSASSDSDRSLSYSSATSVPEFHTQEDISNAESNFSQDLHGRLMKISQEHQLVSTGSSSRPYQRRPTVRFESNRTKSEIFDFTFRASLMKLELSSTNLKKRSRSLISATVHSPHLTADGPPNTKKRRILRNATVGDKRYATRSATSRRALSLRSQTEQQDTSLATIVPFPIQSTDHDSIPSTLDTEVPADWVPTRPCSPNQDQTPLRRPSIFRDPCYQSSSPSLVKIRRAQTLSKLTRTISFDVPIIAPPLNYKGSPLLSDATQAKTRLIRFRERERRMIEADLSWTRAPSSASLLTSDCSFNDNDDENIDELEGDGCRLETRPLENFDGRHLQHGLGFEMIRWILEVLPSSSTISHLSSSLSASFSSSMDSRTSDPSSSPASENASHGLTDQLLSCPETRFHAAYLFMRFFHIVFGTQETRRKHERGLEIPDRWDVHGSKLATWDTTVACIALSVKLHRDFLPPLFPIYSYQFEQLAPHAMEYEDLEAAQRDILFTLSYNLGGTPQNILDELWTALPSLRELLSFHHGWSSVLQETWLILFEAVADPEIMQFPLSIVTAAAVMEGILSALVREYQIQAPWHEVFRHRRLSRKQSVQECDSGSECEIQPKSVSSSFSSSMSSQSPFPLTTSSGYDTFALRKAHERICRARIASKGVLLDIQTTLGIADSELKACREWISSFVDTRL